MTARSIPPSDPDRGRRWTAFEAGQGHNPDSDQIRVPDRL